MVHLQMNGFIGDNLFQYVVARLVAEELGYALDVSHSRGKSATNVPYLLELLAHCRDAPLKIAGDRYDNPVDYSICDLDDGFDGYFFDLPHLLSDRTPRRVEVRGYFQSYRLLRPHKETIRRWLSMTPDLRGFSAGDRDVVVHVRWGDLVVFGLALDTQYYVQLLQSLEFRHLYVVGYGINREIEAALAPFSPRYVSGTPAQDFRFMLGFPRIILSNSGFGWWAGFLSGAEAIYAPRMQFNSRTEHPKAHRVALEVDDEERFHYIDNAAYLGRDYRLRDVMTALPQLRKKRVISSLRDLLLRRRR